MNYLFMNPVCTYDGKPHELMPLGDGVYAGSDVQVEVSLETIVSGQEKLVCHWKNLTKDSLDCQPEVRICSTFEYTHYLIPGVSYNGNHWGRGKEPKGLTLDGSPWIFDYRRTSLPACTISENKEYYLALMASDQDEASLTASCSMEPMEDGRMLHRLLYPEVERPKTYCTRDGYSDAHEDFITLRPDEVFTTTAYILTGTPYAENFAAGNVSDAALELIGRPFAPAYSNNEVAELAYQFAKQLVMDTNGRKLFSIGQLPTKEGIFENRLGHAIGWCGQNGMYARLILQRGIETSDDALLQIGMSCLDAFSHEAVTACGLLHANYNWMLDGHSDVEDTCNFGFAVMELAQAWRYMHQQGTDKPDWLRAACGVADFLIAHWSDEYGFGKAWNVKTGECRDPQGTIGAYLIPGLAELYHATGEQVYLEAAKKSCRFYRDRDLNQFQCTAGALDTYCIDKESSGPLLAGSLMLYDIEPIEEWLDCAKKAGWYFSSWMFHHDTLPLAGSDFAQYGYRTLGGTSVSAQHHHIDPWGALVVPQMVCLWKITGDAHWQKRARLMWANAIQNIAPANGKTVHGFFRAAGAQNEGYHHCHWGEKGAPGFINDWLVAWPQAFCWNAATKVSQEDVSVLL